MKLHLDQRTLRGMAEAILYPGTLATVLALIILLERWARTGI